MGDRGHRDLGAEQDSLDHPPRHRRLYRRERRRDDPWRVVVDQGLGRRRSLRRLQRDGVPRREGPHVHGQDVRRGADGFLRQHVVHPQRRRARCAGKERRARNVALRATRPASQDAAEVAMPDPALVAVAERLQGICLGKGLSVALAESCTGGVVAAAITSVAGSSGYFLGGVVSYADAAKTALLDVPAAVLEAHGAVSAQVARAMAAGARASFGSDLAASLTGVAGPDGGTPEKPVGLTYVGLAHGDEVEVRRFLFSGDRA